MNILKKLIKNNDIRSGYKIDNPDIFIPWEISQSHFEALLKGHPFKKVTSNYYTIECTSLGGLNHMLGFHFELKKGSNLCHLKLLEFFRKAYPDYEESFIEFQKYFTNKFGNPTREYPINAEGFPAYEWSISYIQIHHYIMDRFGLEERLFIKNVK